MTCRPALALCAFFVVATPSSAAPAEAPQFGAMATSSLNDLQATLSVQAANEEELRKINKDFALAYKLKDVVMTYKRPDKLRMEGKIGHASALYIVNGCSRLYSIPAIRLNKRDELGTAPGKRYSLLEVGLIAKADLPVMDARYLRTESAGGQEQYVFQFKYRGDSSDSYVLWVDPRTHVVSRRDWFDGAGKLKATFLYRDVKEVAAAVWLPTRLEVLNGDGVVAGITQYADVKVNQGIDDSLFQLSSARADDSSRSLAPGRSVARR